MTFERAAVLLVRADCQEEAEREFASLDGAMVGEVLVSVDDCRPIEQHEEA